MNFWIEGLFMKEGRRGRIKRYGIRSFQICLITQPYIFNQYTPLAKVLSLIMAAGEEGRLLFNLHCWNWNLVTPSGLESFFLVSPSFSLCLVCES